MNDSTFEFRDLLGLYNGQGEVYVVETTVNQNGYPSDPWISTMTGRDINVVRHNGQGLGYKRLVVIAPYSSHLADMIGPCKRLCDYIDID